MQVQFSLQFSLICVVPLTIDIVTKQLYRKDVQIPNESQRRLVRKLPERKLERKQIEKKEEEGNPSSTG